MRFTALSKSMSVPGFGKASKGFCVGWSTESVLDSQRYPLFSPSAPSKLSHLNRFVFLFWKMQMLIGMVFIAFSRYPLRGRFLALRRFFARAFFLFARSTISFLRYE